MKAFLILTGVAAVLIAAWVFSRKGQVVERTKIPDDPDGQVLKQLSAAGSDLTKPHDVEFFLYFPDEKRASRACRELEMEGYTGKVDRAAKGPDWLCLVTKRIVPSHATIVAIRGRMNELARARGGEYDGWGTPVSR